MASWQEMQTKNGEKFYKITVSRGRGKSPYTMRWYIPDGWSRRNIDNKIKTVAAAFENDCRNGLVKNRKELQEEKERLESEQAKIETVKQYGERVFMPSKKIQCAENTRLYYQEKLEKHIYPAFGSVKLPELSSAMISAFILEKQDSCISFSYLIGIYNTFKQLLKMAYMDDLISANPMDKVQRPRQIKTELQNSGIKAFTENELVYIIDCLKKEPLKWETYIRLMIETGCRRGELCGLKWDCINFSDFSVVIKNNLCYTAEKGVYNDTTKTGKERTVYISAEVVQLLQRFRDRQKEEIRKRTKRLEKEHKPLELSRIALSEYVFTEKGYNTPMHPQAPNRYFKKFSEKYNIKDFHPHKLRHSFASVAITNGADIASVSEILGHADKATTLRMYTHADAEAQKRAAEVYRNALNKNRESKKA